MCELLWTQDAFPAANILHCSYTGGTPDATNLQVLALALGNAFWEDPVIEDYATTTTFVGVRLTDLATDTGAVGEGAINGAGTAEDQGSPAQCCLMVNYSIARRYRGGHPRSYFPALAIGAISTPGQWDSGVVSDFTSQVTALNAAMGSASSGPITLTGQVVVSYVDGDAWRVDNLVEPVTGLTVNNLIKTQRRRLTSSSY